VAEPEAGGFEDFAVQALPGLLRFGHVLTGSPQEAEDLVQEAMAKALRRWRTARADDPVSYVRTIMVNTHLTRWRRWGSRIRLGEVPEPAAEDTGLARSQDWDTLRRALIQLPVRQRAVVVLRYLEDVPDEVISAMLSCRPATVRSLAARGLAALRPLLAAQTTGTGHGGAGHGR
jgi:RNA polymerase sigma-70 factor (sigma-E family)